MQILLSCAKDMTTECTVSSGMGSMPFFQTEAEDTAIKMMAYSADELGLMLKINPQLAALNKLRYTAFLEPEPKMEAVFSYTGIAYKYLNARAFTHDELVYARQHLWITSFLYGLLRPLDLIKNYRLEGNVRPDGRDGPRMFDFWKPRLTDLLIDSVQHDDGLLLNVASSEMKHLFDWPRVCREVQVIEPGFMVSKGGKLKTVVVYCKMCRGAMSRYVIQHRPATAAQLTAFEFEGFAYNESAGSPGKPVFVLE